MPIWRRLQLGWIWIWAWLTRGDPVWFVDCDYNRVYLRVARVPWNPMRDPSEHVNPYVTYRKRSRTLQTNGKTRAGDQWRYVSRKKQVAHELAWGGKYPEESRWN